MPTIVCNDCDHITSNPSATGPIKEVDEDGKLYMNWAYICPKCFSENVRPYARNQR